MKEKLDLGKRPKCATSGCEKECHFIGNYRKDGSPIFRQFCGQCHIGSIVEKNGFDNVQTFLNTRHPYRKYRKEYCENIDARLGFVCTTNILFDVQLQVDHINGNPSDNREKNLQTLCACCHIFKTHMNKDYMTPGRKKLFTKILTK